MEWLLNEARVPVRRSVRNLIENDHQIDTPIPCGYRTTLNMMEAEAMTADMEDAGMPTTMDATFTPINVNTAETSDNMNTTVSPSNQNIVANPTAINPPPWVPSKCRECNQQTGERCSKHAEQIARMVEKRKVKNLTKKEKTRINREVSDANWDGNLGQRKLRKLQRQAERKEDAILKAFGSMSLVDHSRKQRKTQRRQQRRILLSGPQISGESARANREKNLARAKATKGDRADRKELLEQTIKGELEDFAQGPSERRVGDPTSVKWPAEQHHSEGVNGESEDFLTRASQLIEETLNSNENRFSTQGANNLREALSLIQTTSLLRPDENIPRRHQPLEFPQAHHDENNFRPRYMVSPLILHEPLPSPFPNQQTMIMQRTFHRTPIPGSPTTHPSRVAQMSSQSFDKTPSPVVGYSATGANTQQVNTRDSHSTVPEKDNASQTPALPQDIANATLKQEMDEDMWIT